MEESDLSESVLVIVGHGSSRNPDSCLPIYQQADTLRGRELFREVVEAFWKQKPDLPSVMGSLSATRVFVLPFFISDGYFTTEALPAALGLTTGDGGAFRRCVRRGHQVVCYCKPIGSHHGMTEVLLKQASQVVESHPGNTAFAPTDTALVIVGHGTERNRDSRKAIEKQVDRIRARNVYAEVVAVYLEEPPYLPEVYDLTSARSLVVLPYFVSDGMHSREDIPVALGEPSATVKGWIKKEKPPWTNPTILNGRTIWLTQAIGREPRLADLIMEHVREAATWKPE